MRLLITPNPFKECLDSSAVAKYLAIGFRQAKNYHKITLLPLSDGGMGSCLRIASCLKDCRKFKCKGFSPLGKRMETFFLEQQKTKKIFIESASVCGIHLVPKNKRKPLATSSAGLGRLILAALKRRPK